jgi:hypothetical protein
MDKQRKKPGGEEERKTASGKKLTFNFRNLCRCYLLPLTFIFSRILAIGKNSSNNLLTKNHIKASMFNNKKRNSGWTEVKPLPK